jgi:hypothetical protein
MVSNNKIGIQIAEEVIFYLDLSTDFMKKRRLVRAIEAFIDENNKTGKKERYGLVLFRSGKELYTIYNQESKIIIETIKDLWDERERENNYFENGLYEILAYIFKKSRKIRKIYRVIVLSDSPSRLSDDYHSALYDLVLKAKNFQTYIDIIRLGDEKFYKDDVKLKVISSETFGGTLYCRDEKNLKRYLSSIVRSREDFSIETPYIEKISEEDHEFFERLATDLISLSTSDEQVCFFCKEKICKRCNDPMDELHKCFNCGACFHDCCVAHYSIENNIGIPYIFRCPQCDALLKLEKEIVDLFIKQEDHIRISESTEAIENQKLLEESRENEQEPSTTSLDNIPPLEQNITSSDKEPERNGSIKIGGFFGPEVEVNKIKTSIEILESPDEEFSRNRDENKKISITSLSPPKSKADVKFCPICGASIRSNTCPNCGNILKI